MSSKPGRILRKCSCLSCKQEISIVNFSRHIKANSCHVVKTCKHCNVPLSDFTDAANHVQWCESNPDILKKKKIKSEQLNRSWKTDYYSRIQRIKATKLERYGNENYNNLELAEVTKFERYGDPYYANREKGKDTCILRYGVEYPQQIEWCKAQTRITNNEKYGVDYAFLLPENRPKDTNRIQAKSTMFERYGVEYSAQSPEIHAKMQSHRNTNKTFTFPSGNTYTVQGYEPKALTLLLKCGYVEEDIQLRNRKAIKYEFDDVTHYYHPDIIIPNENRIIEVKSRYWFEREFEKNLAKKIGTEKAGFSFEFMIFE